jgi:hypothetical protein
MTTRELLQMALDALNEHCRKHPTTEALRAHLAKTEPEPVAWMTEDTGNGQYAMWGQKPMSEYWINNPDKLIPLFTKEQL